MENSWITSFCKIDDLRRSSKNEAETYRSSSGYVFETNGIYTLSGAGLLMGVT